MTLFDQTDSGSRIDDEIARPPRTKVFDDDDLPRLLRRYIGGAPKVGNTWRAPTP